MDFVAELIEHLASKNRRLPKKHSAKCRPTVGPRKRRSDPHYRSRLEGAALLVNLLRSRRGYTAKAAWDFAAKFIRSESGAFVTYKSGEVLRKAVDQEARRMRRDGVSDAEVEKFRRGLGRGLLLMSQEFVAKFAPNPE